MAWIAMEMIRKQRWRRVGTFQMVEDPYSGGDQRLKKNGELWNGRLCRSVGFLSANGRMSMAGLVEILDQEYCDKNDAYDAEAANVGAARDLQEPQDDGELTSSKAH
ncbi:hypothetical protein ACLOJK_016876 [Asimina triloba]